MWAGLVVAPSAWALTGLLGYLLVSRSCEPGVNGLHFIGFRNPALWLVVLGVVMAIATAAALWASLGAWRAVERTRPPGDAELERAAGAEDPSAHGTAPAYGRTHFLSFAGLLAASLFLLGIVLFAYPALVLNACTQAH